MEKLETSKNMRSEIEKSRIKKLMNNVKSSVDREKKEKPIENIDAIERESNWLLRPGSGLGEISIGDNISIWEDLLKLEGRGDFYNQMADFFGEFELNFENDESFRNDDFLFESKIFDMWFHADSLMNIKRISTAERCIFNDVDLLNSKIATIKKSFGIPSFFHKHSLGFAFFYEKIGVSAHFLENKHVDWISVYAPENE